ncbi:MAG: LLM class flavin-dependent oxidoreductase [Dehalococcoidia bacterium]|nr:LLM class flavin-dependent oxidoreductase [Dehalococcoidia bacterium]
MTLTVVDQSPVRHGGTAADALRESVLLAQAAERCGYARYWVTEHHNIGTLAGASPEILIGQIAARTQRIRVGSAGVMLSHYSALKVAEQFRILEAFHPGRIDLGIGRAPGSDPRTAQALAYPRLPANIHDFPQQVTDLLSLLEGAEIEDERLAGIKAQPGLPHTVPEVWLLGSSDYSARLAAMLGLPFAFADFFGTTGDHGPLVTEMYVREFSPSKYLSEPKVNVTVQALCAPTTEEARYHAASRDLMRANRYFNLGLENTGILPPEEALAFPLPDAAREYMRRQAQRNADGDPEQVRQRLLEAAERYGTTDIGIVTSCYDFAARARSYELIAQLRRTI